MSTKENNRSIAYIYNEMDPSEKVEFERDLENDSDLLIEVESLKQISKRINRLELIQPPEHLVNSVCEAAKNSSNSRSNINLLRTFLYSAAALLLIGFTSGILLMDNQQTDSSKKNVESASVSGSPTFSQPISSSSPENLKPWVDNNDILYFQDQTGPNQTSMDSIMIDSYKKLTPVNPSGVRPYQRLQLTGSRN